MSLSTRTYGWKRGLPNRSFPKLTFDDLKPESALPKKVDMRNEFPESYDQGQLGSCTANGVGSLIHRLMIILKYQWQFTPSRLFMYYNVRALEGSIHQDAGAIIADVIKVVNQFGVCPEAQPSGQVPDWYWTYDDNTSGIPFINPPKFQKKPPAKCYDSALLHRALKTHTVKLDRLNVLNALASGNTFTFGFAVYESFETQEMAKTGIMPIPGESEDLLGGHCVTAVGYLLDTPMGKQGVRDWVLVRNSWGTSWGDHGAFYMPLDKVLCNSQLSSDAHCIDVVGHQK